MKLQKWNFEIREYEDFDSPAENPALYVEDMREIRQCANCGKSVKYGDMYTSKTIHTEMGFGYVVCEECYREEWILEKRDKLERGLDE